MISSDKAKWMEWNAKVAKLVKEPGGNTSSAASCVDETDVSYGVGVLVLGEQPGATRGTPLYHSLDVLCE